MRTRLHGRRPLLRAQVLVATCGLLLAACAGAPGTDSPTPPIPPASTPSASTPQESAPPGSFSPALLPAPELDRVTIAVDAVEANTFVPRLALDAGLYEKYGLTVEVLPFDGEQQTLAGLVAGQVQSSIATPTSTLTSMTSEAPLQDVAVFNNRFLDCIVTKPDITDAASLQGRRMAVSDLAGQSHAETLIALKALGLTHEDAEIVQIGGQSARVAALQAGSVDAIPADCVTAEDLVDEGFRILLRLPELDIQFAGTNVQFLRSFIERNPNTVLAVTAANLEAMQLLFIDEDMAVEALAPWAQISEAEARAAIVDFKGVAQRDLRPTKDAYANVRDVALVTNPAVADVDLEQASTSRFLDQLRDLGLNAQLAIPES